MLAFQFPPLSSLPPFSILLCDAAPATLQTSFLFIQLAPFSSLPTGEARGRLVGRRREENTRSFLSASCFCEQGRFQFLLKQQVHSLCSFSNPWGCIHSRPYPPTQVPTAQYPPRDLSVRSGGAPSLDSYVE